MPTEGIPVSLGRGGCQESRPNVCKEFQAVSSDGIQNIRCMKARKSAGLDPYLK